jgi:hypothetical protein
MTAERKTMATKKTTASKSKPKPTTQPRKPRKGLKQRRLDLAKRRRILADEAKAGLGPPVPPLKMLAQNLLRPRVQAALVTVFFDVALPALAVFLVAMDELDKHEEREQHTPPTPDPAVAAAVGKGSASIIDRPYPPPPDGPLVVEKRAACNCARCSARRVQQGVN